MADISMCLGRGCKVKDECYRFTATPNPYRQSYMEFDNQVVMHKSDCPDFRPNGISPHPIVTQPETNLPISGLGGYDQVLRDEFEDGKK
jgi:hypothetical protein